jgi:preprotein translocase subunit SecY
MHGGQTSYIPFKINTVGIMPVIFATATLNIPIFIITFIASKIATLEWLVRELSPMGLIYNVFEFFLIVFFYFIYTAMQFNPDDLAENLKKGGGFLLGIRPGKKTAEYFNYILNRLGLVGAFYLAVLALLPSILQAILQFPVYLGLMSGTSLLIVVGVALEMAAQIESYLIENKYEGFLVKGRLTSRSVR